MCVWRAEGRVVRRESHGVPLVPTITTTTTNQQQQQQQQQQTTFYDDGHYSDIHDISGCGRITRIPTPSRSFDGEHHYYSSLQFNQPSTSNDNSVEQRQRPSDNYQQLDPSVYWRHYVNRQHRASMPDWVLTQQMPARPPAQNRVPVTPKILRVLIQQVCVNFSAALHDRAGITYDIHKKFEVYIEKNS